jgi:aspartate beta-hydroxylase
MTERVKLTPHPQSDDETSWRVRYFYLLGEEQAEAHQLCRKLLRPSKAASQQDPATRCLPGPHCPALWCREYTSDLPPRTGCDTGLPLRVSSEVVSWQEGKCLVFDDSFEHEVWNKSDCERVVLLIQFWHPDLTEAVGAQRASPLLGNPRI